jgi:hypothetical protein
LFFTALASFFFKTTSVDGTGYEICKKKRMVERVGFEQYSYLSTGAAPSDRDRAVFKQS